MIPAVLDRLGIDYDLRGDEAWALCPMHEQRTGKQDHNPSWSINIVSGKFLCFSCQYKGALPRLVRDLRGFTEEQAAEWIGSEEIDPAALQRKVKSARPRRVVPVRAKVDEATFLSKPYPTDEQLASRHLAARWAEEYTLRYDNGWLIPIRDADGVLQGWQQKMPDRVRNYPVGVKKSRHLFGLWELPSVLGPVVVVESPLDAVLCAQSGHPAVALYGAFPSEDQITLMLSFPEVILALDNDEVGRASQQKLADTLVSLGTLVKTVIYPDGVKDFGDAPDRISDFVTQAESPLKTRMNIWKTLLK